MNIPKFRNIKGTLYIDKETYNRDVMQVKEYKEDEIDRLNNIIKEVREYIQDRYDGEVLTHTFDKDNAKELHDILKENKNAKD